MNHNLSGNTNVVRMNQLTICDKIDLDLAVAAVVGVRSLAVVIMKFIF